MGYNNQIKSAGNRYRLHPLRIVGTALIILGVLLLGFTGPLLFSGPIGLMLALFKPPLNIAFFSSPILIAAGAYFVSNWKYR